LILLHLAGRELVRPAEKLPPCTTLMQKKVEIPYLYPHLGIWSRPI
jgi:hypothetical protein